MMQVRILSKDEDIERCVQDVWGMEAISDTGEYDVILTDHYRKLSMDDITMPVVLIASNSKELVEFNAFAIHYPNMDVIMKPLSQRKLKRAVEYILNASKLHFTGNLRLIPISQLVQIVSGMKGMWCVKVISAGKYGEIYTIGGMIVHASFNGSIGEKAMNRMFELEKGVFKLVPKTTNEINIVGKVDELVLRWMYEHV